MIPRLLVLIGLSTIVPAIAAAQSAELAPPATLSALDPVRIASDFAPDGPAAPAVAPFEQAVDDTTSIPAESLAPADPIAASVLPVLPSGPVGEGFAPAEQPPLVGSIVGALVGGAVGALAGGGLGYAAHGDGGDGMEALPPMFFGASLGEVFLMPLGAHVGNGSRGSYGLALGGSLLGYLATLGLTSAGPVGTAAGLLLQTTLTVGAERLSASQKMKVRAEPE